MLSLTEKVKSLLKMNKYGQQDTDKNATPQYNAQQQEDGQKQSIFHRFFNIHKKQPQQRPKSIKKMQSHRRKSSRAIFQTSNSISKQQQKLTTQQDDDQDSLGYTQNQWDEQTINFQLQDRLLDCLQDQKHANEYRQSLIVNTNLRKKSSNRNSKDNIQPPSPQEKTKSPQKKESAQVEQNRKEQVKQKPRKNRFQKYQTKCMQNDQNDDILNKKQYLHNLNELQKNADLSQKQKLDKLAAMSDKLTCEDYIDQLFKLDKKSSKLIGQPKQDVPNGQQLISKSRKQQQRQRQSVDLTKKEQIYSQNSLQIVEQGKKLGVFLSNDNQLHQPLRRSFRLDYQKLQAGTPNQQINFLDIMNNIKDGASLQPQRVNRLKQPQIKQYRQAFNNKQKQASQSSRKQRQFVGQQKEESLKSIGQVDGRSITFITPQKNVVTRPNKINISQQRYLFNNCSDKRISLSKSKQKRTIVINNTQVKTSLSKQKMTRLPIIFSPSKPQTNRVNAHVTNFNQNQIRSAFNLPQSNMTPQKNINAPKSPINKVNFKYVSQNQGNLNDYNSKRSTELVKIVSNSPNVNSCKKINENYVRYIYRDPQTQQQIPIFLQRLRRLTSVWPNIHFYSQVNLIKVNSDLRIVLSTMKSAISVVQLLYKKICFQKNRLQELFIKISQCAALPLNQAVLKNILEKQIYQFFVYSQWQSYKIEEIDYIKPRQKFIKRNFNSSKIDDALKSYTEFIDHYLNSSITGLETSEQKNRYIRIRQKISQIVKYLKMISEDLYVFWLEKCHYPYVYTEYLQFMKGEDRPFGKTLQPDEILARLIQLEQAGDYVSLSVIGRKIRQKVEKSFY